MGRDGRGDPRVPLRARHCCGPGEVLGKVVVLPLVFLGLLLLVLPNGSKAGVVRRIPRLRLVVDGWVGGVLLRFRGHHLTPVVEELVGLQRGNANLKGNLNISSYDITRLVNGIHV